MYVYFFSFFDVVIYSECCAKIVHELCVCHGVCVQFKLYNVYSSWFYSDVEEWLWNLIKTNFLLLCCKISSTGVYLPIMLTVLLCQMLCPFYFVGHNCPLLSLMLNELNCVHTPHDAARCPFTTAHLEKDIYLFIMHSSFAQAADRILLFQLI